MKVKKKAFYVQIAVYSFFFDWWVPYTDYVQGHSLEVDIGTWPLFPLIITWHGSTCIKKIYYPTEGRVSLGAIQLFVARLGQY